MATYKCLSVRQPWVGAIFLLGKQIENRSWATPYRGALLIHASSRKVKREIDESMYDIELIVGRYAPHLLTIYDGYGGYGQIVGLVDLVDCKWSNKGNGKWGQPECYHWHLKDPRLFKTPISQKGSLGIFDVELSSLEFA